MIKQFFRTIQSLFGVCIAVCACVSVYNVSMHMYVWMCVRMCVFIYVCVYAHVCMFVCTCSYIYMLLMQNRRLTCDYLMTFHHLFSGQEEEKNLN